jgi:hypothetical protein
MTEPRSCARVRALFLIRTWQSGHVILTALSTI